MSEEMNQETGNPFINELKKFMKKEVTVEDQNGKTFTGIVKGIQFQYSNFVIMTDKEKILIRNVANVRRTRTSILNKEENYGRERTEDQQQRRDTSSSEEVLPRQADTE